MCVTGLFVLALAVPAAQAQMAQGAPQTITLSTGLQRSYDDIKRNLTEMSEEMAEGDYTFMPTKDVRTFGQLMGHAANAQFNACAAARGMANPNQGNDNEKKASKAEFVKALADSFAFCDEAFKSLTDASAVEMVKQGQNSVARGVGAGQPHRPQQRGLRHGHPLHALEGPDPALDRAGDPADDAQARRQLSRGSTGDTAAAEPPGPPLPVYHCGRLAHHAHLTLRRPGRAA